MCQGLFKEARKMSAQTLNKCSGERCFCGTVTGIFSSANLCLCSGDLDVASCNNRHNCLISCAEILIGTGLKYAQCLWGLPVYLDCFLFRALCWTVAAFFYHTVYYTFFTSPVILGTSPSVMPGWVLVLVSVYAGREWSNSHPEFSEMLCLFFEFEVMFEGVGPAHLFRVKPVGNIVLNPWLCWCCCGDRPWARWAGWCWTGAKACLRPPVCLRIWVGSGHSALRKLALW